MKALTNILTQLLMLMLLLVACTEETAEVETLSRQQLMVDMQVSGMKATTRAGEEETINTVTALVFRNDVLTSVEKMVKLANSNNFVMNLPQSNDVIHFLANLPDDVVLPTQMEGSQQSVLKALYTEDKEKLSYWGMATYYGGNQLGNVLLYRNMAMITIEPSAEDAVFTQEQLKIAGLVNANTKGMLVPYKDAFNFDLGNENDYNTLPESPAPQTDSSVQPLTTSTYVFEHDNPDTSAGLYVICKIGDYYYKVALADEEFHPYDIIRNHKYVIKVADVCDVPDNQRSTDYSTVVYNCAPINMVVQEIKNVTLSLSHSVYPFNYSEFAHEAFTVTVGNVRGVERLTFTAPECFDIASGYATLENGEYVIADTNRDQINFTFKLKDGMIPDNQLTIGVDGSGTYVNVTETQIQLNTASYQGNDMVLWMGSVILDVNDDRTKIPIPYSLFQDGTIEAGDQIQIYFEDAGDGDRWIQAATPTEGDNWDHLPSFNGENGSPNTFTLTTNDLEQINRDHKNVWGWNEIDAAFFIQGIGRKLTKVVLIPAKSQITAGTPTPTSLYYNSNEEQTVTINVTIPSGVTTLNIKADDFSSVKQGDTSLEKSNDIYVYTRAAEKVATEETIPFVLTLNRDKFSQQQYDTSTNIIFSDGSSVEENAKATQDQVSVSLKPVPVVSFQYDANNTTLYWNNSNPTSLQVNMNNVPQNARVKVNITNAAAFTITSTSGELTGPVEGVYTYTGGNTSFIIKPASEGSVRNDAYTIGFSGSGENVTVEETNIIVTVEGAPTSSMSVTPTAIINLDENQTSATLTLRKPANVQSLKVDLSDYSVFNISASDYSYTWNDGSSPFYYYNVKEEEVNFTFTVKNSAVPVGDYTITFYNSENQSMFTTATISLTRMFVYNNKTLYLKDKDGNDNPTSLKVTFNAPSESSTLSISAGGFDVRAEGRPITGDNGTYTYTGGPTVFTFTPTETGTKSIVFDGTDIVDTTIEVKVEEQEPDSWLGPWTPDNSNVYVKLSNEDISKFELDKTLCIVAEYMQDITDWHALRIMGHGNYNGQNMPSAEERYNLTQDMIIRIVLKKKDVDMISGGNGFEFWGHGVRVTEFYIE